jgi:hypothetical protein
MIDTPDSASGADSGDKKHLLSPVIYPTFRANFSKKIMIRFHSHGRTQEQE